MSKMYMVCVRRVVRPDLTPERIDKALGPLGDWLRYNGSTWLVFTSLGAEDVDRAVRPALDPPDSILVVRVEPREIAGWAPADVWNWLQSKRPEATLSDILRRGP